EASKPGGGHPLRASPVRGRMRASARADALSSGHTDRPMSRLSGFSHRAGEATVDESRRETTCRHRTVHVPRLRKARTWRRAARAALGVAVVVAAVVLVATDARAQGVLENPQPGAA